MERKGTISVRNSIRTRLLILFLGLTSITLFVSGYFGITTLFSATNNAEEISKAVLKQQASDFMVQIVEKIAQQNDAALDIVHHNANYLAFYANDVFENQEQYHENSQWRAADHIRKGSSGQFTNDADETTSVYLPNTATFNERTILHLELSSFFEVPFQSIYENSENITAIYLGTEDDITRYYPNINLGEVLPPDFKVTQRPWYINATQENRQREVVWSEVYEDATGQGLLVTAAIPLYQNDKLVGVIGIDVSLDAVQEIIESSQVFENSYTFLIDKTGQAIILPEQGYLDILGQASDQFETTPNLREDSIPNFNSVITTMVGKRKGLDEVQSDEGTFIVAYAPLNNTGWSLATVVPEAQLLQSFTLLQEELDTNTRQLIFSRLLMTGLALLALSLLIGYWATGQLVNPIKELVDAVQTFGRGNWDVSLPKGREDEIGALTNTFKNVTDQLRDTMSNLEERVDERTKDLENRALQLQAAAQVAHDALVFQNTNDLLANSVNLISEKFGYYHAGLFLLDDKKEYAILQAASSDGGKIMLERGHQLQVGSEGIVGATAAERRPHIALDVGTDAVYFNNPDLPETHSEMALPLLSQSDVLGVLDIQSTKAQAFSQQDIEIFQTLANQLALALQNARLLEESKTSIAQLEALAEMQTEAVWKTHLERQTHGFVYTPLGTKQLRTLNDSTPEEGAEHANIPINLRGKTIGKIALSRRSKRWANQEKTLISDIAEQVGLAIENSRLVDETREQSNRDQLVSEFSTKLRETLDMDTVVRTAIEEMKKTFNLNEAEIRLNPPNENKEKN